MSSRKLLPIQERGEKAERLSMAKQGYIHTLETDGRVGEHRLIARYCGPERGGGTTKAHSGAKQGEGGG